MRNKVHLLGAALLFTLGLQFFSFTSWSALGGSLAAMAAALVWFCYALLFLGERQGLLYRRRREIALTLVSTALCLLLALASSIGWEMGPSQKFQQEFLSRDDHVAAQQHDAELGWAPGGPPDMVGQRLDKVDPTRPQLVVIGDSILYGLHLPAEETAVHLLDDALPNVQAVNLSVSGYSIEQYWLYLRRVLPHVRSKLIVVGIFTGNDFQLTGREFTPYGMSKPLYHVENGQLVRWNHAERCVDGLATSLLFRWLWRDKERAVELVKLACDPRILRHGETERAIAKQFEAIEALGRERGVPVLWVLLPNVNAINVYDGDRTKYVERYLTLRRLLHGGGHDTFDFFEELKRQHAQHGVELGPLFQEDNSHLTAAGQRLLADSLLRVIRERHLLR